MLARRQHDTFNVKAAFAQQSNIAFERRTGYAHTLLLESAQYAEGQKKLEHGRADYAAGRQRLEEAKAQYAEGEAKLEKIKPIYDMVQPAYQRYLDMKAQYDAAVANGEYARAALLWGSVEAQKLVYESQIAGTGYSMESIVQQYEDGQRQLSEGAAQIAEAEQQLESGRATLNNNKTKLTQELGELESYSDDLERLEHGVAILMNDDEISSRARDNASYADICSIAEDHYNNDITRAERENNIRTVICALTLVSAVIILICALLHKRQSQCVAALAAISSVISGGCALAAAILGTSVILPIAALALMLMTLLFGEIYLKRSNK